MVILQIGGQQQLHPQVLHIPIEMAVRYSMCESAGTIFGSHAPARSAAALVLFADVELAALLRLWVC